MQNIKYHKKQLIDIYYAYIHCHLTYETSIWGPYLNKNQINKMESEQRKAMRYVCGTNYRVNYDDLYKSVDF